MNWKRIVMGGLVAGVVFNLLELAFEPLLGAQMELFFTRLGLPVPGEGAMMALAGSSFGLGVLAVWLYAAIRPRYGASKVTAVIAGLAVWALSCLLPNIALYSFGLFTVQFFLLASVCPLVESILATLAGAWIYSEAPSPEEELVAARA